MGVPAQSGKLSRLTALHTMPNGWVPEVPDGWAVDEVPDKTEWAEWQVLWAARVGTVGEFARESTEAPPQHTQCTA